MEKLRGFAAMSPEKLREISSRGGKAAQSAGVGHRFTKDEAREAGRLGGLASKGRKRLNIEVEDAPIPYRLTENT